jgi:hypothetical protein
MPTPRLKPIPTVAHETTETMKPRDDLSHLCDELRALQRQRVVNLKSRNMLQNRLRMAVCVHLGYHSSADEKERKAMHDKADAYIEGVLSGKIESTAKGFIESSDASVRAFDVYLRGFEKEMERLAAELPAAEWVNHPDRRGFALGFLAQVVGECGDLNNYENPGKLWRRMGCAPFESKGKNLMGATWRSGKEGKLSAEEWEEYGYCPHRRSISFLIGQNMKMQNQSGPYRKRYDEAKAAAAKLHPDWPKMRLDRHAMLLASKRVLLDLWVFWTGRTLA